MVLREQKRERNRKEQKRLDQNEQNKIEQQNRKWIGIEKNKIEQFRINKSSKWIGIERYNRMQSNTT